MIWVRSCGKIHEFEADSWRAYEQDRGGTLYIISGEDNQPLRDGSNIVAEFTDWDWVRFAESNTELLDDAKLND